ncbi:BRO-N domain-containing protein [Algoriphagus hitonicola]|uniref:Bro-N domain-containing protein n=1 Tax=Algoriphagus hitonicola TaxID=435880 RepID=A0A1I2WDT7_9BACT|nr:hypothetical protein [Algoriphagus hitonicola]SFG99425.1 hypothetical protein SAMN04487988_11288 [Algoriphagus hitonicola]
MSKVEPFGDKNVRVTWDKEREGWYFAIADIIGALTNQQDPFKATKDLRKKNKKIAEIWKEIWTPVEQMTKGGRQPVNSASAIGLTRIIVNMNSGRIHLFRDWLRKLNLDLGNKNQNIQLTKKQFQDLYDILTNPESWKKRRREFLLDQKNLPIHQKMNDLEVIFALLKTQDFKY